jgi:spore coat protein CotH
MKTIRTTCALLAALLTCNTSAIIAQTEGDSFFGMAQVHDVYLDFPQTYYWDSLVAYMPLEKYLKGNIVIDGDSLNDIGIKFKGNSSYTNPSTKKPFKIDLNEYVSGQDHDGLKKFNLNNGFKDPSFLREKLALDFYNEHNLPAPRCSYTRVYLNDQYWGLYNFVEEVNKTFLDDDNRFANKQGNLFKGDPTGDLRWYGTSVSSYDTKYELHTNETANDWTDLIDFINKINNSGSFLYDSLETVFNTTKFIQQWAAMNMFVNLDSYIGSGHNYFVYHDTLTDKFNWISWDVNESFGEFTMGLTSTQLKNLSMFYSSTPAGNRPLVEKMLTVPAYKQELINTICNWVGYDFSNAGMDSKIDSIVNIIRPDVYADTKKFYTNANFEDNINMDVSSGGPPPGGGTFFGIKSFINERRNFLISELASNGCTNIGIGETASTDQFSVYPNPANDYFQIDFSNKSKENTWSLYNIMGEKIDQGTAVASVRIDVSFLAAGMYILQVNHSEIKKILKN